MHGERKDMKVRRVYAPATLTIDTALRARGIAARRVAVMRERLKHAFSRLLSGDVLIWVGMHSAQRVPFTQLHRAGVYTIYYSTEPYNSRLSLIPPHPSGGCRLPNADEIWDYSQANIDQCREWSRNGSRPMRYLPPGAYKPCRFVERCAVKHATPIRPLAFVGWLNPFLVEGRAKCLKTLRRGGGFNVSHFGQVITSADFRALYASHDVFLNLHQRCGDDAEDLTQPFEAFRAADLLGHRALLISARSDPRDEANFDGIVAFANLSATEDVYRALATLSTAERTSLAKARSAEFRRRFDPETLFRAAGVPEAFDRLGVRRTRTTRARDSGEVSSEELLHDGNKLTSWLWKHSV